MEKTIERLVNGNIKVTIPIRLKYDGCKTVIHQPEVEQAELDPETMSPLQKAVIQGFQYRDMLESGKVATVSELAQKAKQERAFLFRALSLVNLKCTPKVGHNFWGALHFATASILFTIFVLINL